MAMNRMNMNFSSEAWLRKNIDGIDPSVIEAWNTYNVRAGRGVKGSSEAVAESFPAPEDPTVRIKALLDVSDPANKKILNVDHAVKLPDCPVYLELQQPPLGNRNKKVGKGAKDQAEANKNNEAYKKRQAETGYVSTTVEYKLKKGVAIHSEYRIQRVTCHGVLIQRFTDEEWFDALKKRLDGWSFKKIADSLGRTPHSVRAKFWYMAQKGLCPKSLIKDAATNRWTKEEVKTLIKMKNKGCSNKEIAEKLGRTEKAVYMKFLSLRK